MHIDYCCLATTRRRPVMSTTIIHDRLRGFLPRKACQSLCFTRHDASESSLRKILAKLCITCSILNIGPVV